MTRCCSNWKPDDPYYCGWAIGNGYGLWIVDHLDDQLNRVCKTCFISINNYKVLVRELERYPGDDQHIFDGLLHNGSERFQYIKTYNIENENFFTYNYCCGPPPPALIGAFLEGQQKIRDGRAPLLALR